jgi:hypothetical protein
MKSQVNFIIDENVLTVYPLHPLMKKWLSYKERRLEKTRYGARTVEEKKDLFWIDETNPQVLKTYQGLWKYLADKCLEHDMLPKINDVRATFPEPKLHLMRGLYPIQHKFVVDGLSVGYSGIFSAPTRFGKCFGEDTPVMMADGSIKPIQDIKDGEEVMGPDSKPRKVIGAIRGHGPLYRIVPKNGGDPWICNEDHILHLERTGESGRGGLNRKGRRENVLLKDYLSATKWFRHVRKMRRAPVEFPEASLKLPPYIYGCWLGDGHAGLVAFTNAEAEVWMEIEAWAESQGLHRSKCNPEKGNAETRYYVTADGKSGGKKFCSPWRQWFTSHPKSKGIEKRFLKASRTQRLELLAGLVDTDGEVNGGLNYGIVTKHRQLAEDIKILADGLGFPAHVSPTTKQAQTGPPRQYWRVLLRGAQNEIPVRVPRKKLQRKDKFDALRFGFDVEPVGDGAYYGFELDGPDRLFLLKDGTVVHNSYCMAAIIQAFPHMKTVVLVPGEDLGEQLYDDLTDLLGYKLVMIGCGSKHQVQGDKVTICSMDSMHKLDHAGSKLVLIDEVHTLVTDKRLEQYLKLNMSRKYGFGATAAGRYDRRDLLTEAVIGPVLSEISFTEAVEADVIAPIEVFMLVVPYDTANVSSDRQRAYKQMLWESPYIGNLVQATCARVLPPDWQTLLFIEEEKSAEFFGAKLPGSFISMAKRLTKKERRAAKHKMVRAEISYCLASRIYSQGVTFPDLRVVINLTGGGANTYAVQKPGRVAQKRPGKRCGVLIDFLFRGIGNGKDGSWSPHRDAHARLELYKERGYQVNVIEDLSTFPEVFKKKCL